MPASPREIEVFEAIMQTLRLNSGVYRTTFHNRFRNLDPFVNELLAERFGADAPLEIHDWAASDCLTSSEWAASLLPLFPGAVLKASDLTLFAVEVNYGKHTVIQERDGQPLQYVSPSVVLNLTRPEQRPRILGRLMQKQLQTVLAEVKAGLTITAEWLDSDNESLSKPPFTARKLPMVHPEAALFRVRNARFSIARHSAFDVLPQPVDVIRSMNIYNLSYFEPPRLREGAEAVRLSLKPGGLWIVGRTWQEAPPSHNVSILEKTEAGFKLVRRYGEGSEIESLVLDSHA
ncbi:MAG TPA: hypothetical protein VHY84_20970 [Bryobacteraceae bacterium]|jgi:hypothetical protein|nr:hypothetical protein [Bryobacteraceae bacterium]